MYVQRENTSSLSVFLSLYHFVSIFLSFLFLLSNKVQSFASFAPELDDSVITRHFQDSVHSMGGVHLITIMACHDGRRHCDTGQVVSDDRRSGPPFKYHSISKASNSVTWVQRSLQDA
jgi:hypothetical protein